MVQKLPGALDGVVSSPEHAVAVEHKAVDLGVERAPLGLGELVEVSGFVVRHNLIQDAIPPLPRPGGTP